MGTPFFVHQFIDVVEFQVKPGYGGPVIGGGPVVERVKIIKQSIGLSWILTRVVQG